jgi:RimJ/RimL family protein N-acetyltransferase
MTNEDATPPPWFPLETERLLLRPFHAGDYDDIHAYGADPQVSRFMEWGPNTPEVTAEVLQRQLDMQTRWPRSDVSLALELKATGRLIGSIRLWVVDEANRTAELGYSLAASVWRQGLASEASRAMLAAGFGALSLHRIIATCDVGNLASWGVMEKIGMRREGLMRQDRMIKGARRDTYLYALLAEEYVAQAR